ncbi:MAG: methyltransferase domain-containing protein [Planctomycetota bacterium]
MPRVSILIPNFNNGPASSLDGQTDLIELLLQSLHDTLADDPADLELLAHDDGSTDESLDTLRRWADTTWRNGQPFLSLTVAPHHGVLAITTNDLIARSAGDILVRLDGDTEMLTPHWASKLIELFAAGPPDLGVIAPKQLSPTGRIHALGDFILHPRGYHHVGQGLPRYALTTPVEVDHAMGCMYCIKRETLDDVGPFDEQFLRGQTIDYGLRVRQKGWRCVGHPGIEFVHRHGQRQARDTQADRDAASGKTFDDFANKWGFSRVVPDLEHVADRYAGSPLLWNAAVFGTPFTHPTHAPADPDEWAALANDQAAQQRLRIHAAAALSAAQQVGPQETGKQPTTVLLDNAGPTAHVLAQQGLPVVALDRDADRIARTQQLTKNQPYPAAAPEYRHQTHHRRLPLDDASADLVLLLDTLDTHRNPVAQLTEARRVLRPDGLALILIDPPTNHTAATQRHGFTQQSLLATLNLLGGFTPMSANINTDSPNAPIIVLGKRKATTTAAAA